MKALLVEGGLYRQRKTMWPFNGLIRVGWDHSYLRGLMNQVSYSMAPFEDYASHNPLKAIL